MVCAVVPASAKTASACAMTDAMNQEKSSVIDIDIVLSLGQFQLEAKYQTDQQVLGLFGASGSGKTSILHSVAGIVTPQ